MDKHDAAEMSSRKRIKPYMVTRDKLREAVEEAIGRPIEESRPHFNLLEHHREPPNYYEWHFSDQYPLFPPKGISKWEPEELAECEYALSAGDFQVVPVSNDSAEWPLDQSPAHPRPLEPQERLASPYPSPSPGRRCDDMVSPATDFSCAYNMLDGVLEYLEGISNKTQESEERFQANIEALKADHLQQLLKARADGYNDGRKSIRDASENMLLGALQTNEELRYEMENLQRQHDADVAKHREENARLRTESMTNQGSDAGLFSSSSSSTSRQNASAKPQHPAVENLPQLLSGMMGSTNNVTKACAVDTPPDVVTMEPTRLDSGPASQKRARSPSPSDTSRIFRQRRAAPVPPSTGWQPASCVSPYEPIPAETIRVQMSSREYSTEAAPKRGRIAECRANILRHWQSRSAIAWVSREHSGSLLSAVRKIANIKSFEQTVAQVNYAIIRRLKNSHNAMSRRAYPISNDFRNLEDGVVQCFEITPELLAKFQLRRGNEGFLEDDN